MALMFGLLLVAILGISHHFGLLAIRAMKWDCINSRHLNIVVTFLGLLILHSTEILAFAGVYGLLIERGGFGDLSSANGTWSDLVVFSGISFTTLGDTQIEPTGALRVVSMMQSLGGFMVLTWSATFLYAVCKQSWIEDSQSRI